MYFVQILMLSSILTAYFALQNNSNLENSFIELVEKAFKQKHVFIIHDKSFSDILDQTLANLSSAIFQVETIESVEKLKEKRENVIFMLENCENFDTINEILNNQNVHFGGLFLVVCKNIQVGQLNNFFEQVWKKFIPNVIVLTAVENRVALMTFIPFNSKRCFDFSPKESNWFFDNRWKRSEFFPEKLRNFNNCPLRITTFEYASAVIVEKHENGSYKFSGTDIEILNGLSQALKFKIDLNFLPDYGSWGEIFPNGSATKSHKILVDNQTDAVIGWLFLSYFKTKFVSNSQFYSMIPVVMIIPPGRHLTSLEKLLIPFRVEVWCFLALTVATAVLVILLVKYRIKSLKTFIIGKEIKSPVTELLVAVFGGSSHSLPRKSFPRYLFAIFLLFCLVFRTLYQSGLFQFMQSNKKVKEAETIDELLEQKFTIYSYEAAKESLTEMKFFNR